MVHAALREPRCQDRDIFATAKKISRTSQDLVVNNGVVCYVYGVGGMSSRQVTRRSPHQLKEEIMAAKKKAAKKKAKKKAAKKRK